MNPMQRISVHYLVLSNAEKATCDLIVENPQIVIENPIADAAKKYNVSTSSILRLAKRIGYKGYSEFRYELEKFELSKQREENLDIKNNYNVILSAYENTIDEMLRIDMEQGLKELATLIDQYKVTTVGIGNSSLPAQQLVYSLYSHNKWSECINDTVKINFSTDILDSQDIVIIFSVSGTENTYKTYIEKWISRGVKVILITSNPESPLIRNCYLHFVLPSLPMQGSNDNYQSRYLDSRALFYIFADIIASYYITYKKEK